MSAKGRRDDRITAAHVAATAKNRRRCMVEGCPEYRVWQITGSREESLSQGRRHYLDRHYRAPA